MKPVIKKLTVLFAAIIIISSTAAASTIQQEIKAFLQPVNLLMNNHPSSPINVIFFKDALYVPMDFIIDNLDSTVDWDKSNNTISIQKSIVFQDFPAANPWNGEQFIYGKILSINKEDYTVTIEQHIDDNTMIIDPDISVLKDAVIVLQRNDKKMNIAFRDLKVGEYIGLVLDSKGFARGIILND